MHGITEAYSVQEKTTGVNLIQELSEPFLLEEGNNGRMIGNKAVVILEWHLVMGQGCGYGTAVKVPNQVMTGIFE